MSVRQFVRTRKGPLHRGVELGLFLAQLHNPHRISLGQGPGISLTWLVPGRETAGHTHRRARKNEIRNPEGPLRRGGGSPNSTMIGGDFMTR